MLALSKPCDEKVMAPTSPAAAAAPPPAATGVDAASGEPVLAEVEYVLSEDLKDLSNLDTQLAVRYLSHILFAHTMLLIVM